MTAVAPLPVDPAARTVLLAGNPNAGKTTLFNTITGARAKVGNYPGVTVEERRAPIELPQGGSAVCVDLPGAYSLTSRSSEERIAVDAVLGLAKRQPDALLIVCDATSLERGLYLVSQLLDTGRPAVVALTMMDEARKTGVDVDIDALSERFGVPFVPVVASKNEGIDDLKRHLAALLKDGHSGEYTSRPIVAFTGRTADAIALVANAFEKDNPDASRMTCELWAQWALLSATQEDDLELSSRTRAAVDEARADAERAGEDLVLPLVARRYARVDDVLADVLKKPPPGISKSDRVDAILTHRVWGLVVFALVMAVVFEALFAWSSPVVSLVEDAIAWAQGAATAVLPEGPLTGLVVDGIIAGVGNVIVFVPQIALLFLFITFLEDSGYLARVAFVIDRLMGGVGLHGKAFVPMLSGFACAVPAVMATRTLENKRDRLLTMLAIPFTSCSARLPVYVLVTAAVFDPGARVLSVMSLGAFVLLAMYALSIVAALASTAVLRRTVLKGPRPTLVLELPPYRMPLVSNVLRQTWERVKSFLIDAGTIILAFSIVLWALLSFPKDDAITAQYAELRDQTQEMAQPAQAERLAELATLESGAQLRHSAAGRLGTAMEPALEPLGMDWRIGVGLVGAFAAREVFVSTLGMVMGIGDADEENAPLREALRSTDPATGKAPLTPLSGVALMVFFVLACQCMSTIAVVKRESGSWRWPAFMVAYMTGVAYLAAFLVVQIGTALGFA